MNSNESKNNSINNLNNFYIQKNSNDMNIFNLNNFYQNNGIDSGYYTQFYKYYYNINKKGEK